MQVNILWEGREYYSLENALLNITDSGCEINSVIIGKYQENIYRVEYQIKTNQHWETVSFELKSQQSNTTQQLKFESDGKGNWIIDKKRADQFKGCIDIDIPLTPFTNTLPVNRLKLANGAEGQIQVIYVDLLEQQVKPVRQKYTRLSNTIYRYENVPNDFEANIQVDELGLVVDYPSLFVRTTMLNPNYSSI